MDKKDGKYILNSSFHIFGNDAPYFPYKE